MGRWRSVAKGEGMKFLRDLYVAPLSVRLSVLGLVMGYVALSVAALFDGGIGVIWLIITGVSIAGIFAAMIACVAFYFIDK